MATSKKSRLFLQTIQLILVFILLFYADCSIAGSKPVMNSMVDTADRLMEINRYRQINFTGDELKNVEPPASILNHRIIPFKNDRSCASAALATVLQYTFDMDVNENNVITGLMTYGDKDAIEKKEAFSFYDMKCFLAAIGYAGTGYIIEGPISSEQFKDDDFDHIRNRAIIPIVIDGYSHLTVYRSFDDRYVYLGSPLYGNICMTFDELRKVIVKNSVFIINKPELRK
ncbi:MAG: hypothetical protein ABIK15_04505 [Pseudomonadota bacterium]